MDVRELVPPRGDRVMLVGMTGSGKTTLAEYLLRLRAADRSHVVVLDTKGRVSFAGFQLVTTFGKLLMTDQRCVIFRPSYQELADGETVDRFFEWCYKRGHTTVYVDELMQITAGDVYPYYLGAILTRGRELGVDAWCATQRPMRIPQVVLSETEHTFAFRLKLAQDQERMERTAQIPAATIAGLQKRQFVYAPQDGDVQGPYRLALA